MERGIPKTVVRWAVLAGGALMWTGGAGAQVTQRVSYDEHGNEHNRDSGQADISEDGRFVAFESTEMLTFIVGPNHIYVRDLVTDTLELITCPPFDGESIELSSTSGSFDPVLSGDGRYVCFYSTASLVPEDTNGGERDVYVFDRTTDTYDLISVNNSGVVGDGDSQQPDMTPCGRWVVYHSAATNLVNNDNNGSRDIFWHDRDTGTTRRFSKTTGGVEGNSDSYDPRISDDGQRIVFYSYATNLVVADTNGVRDVFLRDRGTGVTSRVSVDPAGSEFPSNSAYDPLISGDGNCVAMVTSNGSLVPGDDNWGPDIFVKDLTTGAFDVVSVSDYGAFSDNIHIPEEMSFDGRYVLFRSRSENLVLGDVNGIDHDVFLRDRVAGTTQVISVASDGQRTLAGCSKAGMTADAQTVAFGSDGRNLIDDDTNGRSDVFIRGPEMSLSVQPSRVEPGEVFTIATWGGEGNGLLYLTKFDGNPVNLRLAHLRYRALRGWEQGYAVPASPSLQGMTATFQAYGYGRVTGESFATREVTVQFN